MSQSLMIEAARKLLLGHRVLVTGGGYGFGSHLGYCTEIEDRGENRVEVHLSDDSRMCMVVESIEDSYCLGIMGQGSTAFRRIERVCYEARSYSCDDQGGFVSTVLYSGIDEKLAKVAVGFACGKLAFQLQRCGENSDNSSRGFDVEFVNKIIGSRFVVTLPQHDNQIIESFGDESVPLRAAFLPQPPD